MIDVLETALGLLLRLGEVLVYGLLALVFLAVVLGPPGYLFEVLRRKFSANPLISEEARQRARRAAERMKRLARPTLLLVPTTGESFSKLGGTPDLPEDLKWPAGEGGPRTLLAQIDLAELPVGHGVDWLPREGRLYAFYDPGQQGLGDIVQVIHSRSEVRMSAAGLEKLRLRERRVSFEVRTSLPTTDWLNVDDTTVSNDPEDWAAVRDLGDAPPPDDLQHRIGGYPNEIQMECMPLTCEHLARGLPPHRFLADPPPAIERASRQWRLLLQIDSDPALGMNWGDGGRLYVFIKEKHARAGDFSKTVSLWQTY